MWGAGLWEGWGAGLADLGYGLCSVMCRAGKWPLAGGGQSGSQFSQQGPRNVPSYPSCRGLGPPSQDAVVPATPSLSPALPTAQILLLQESE